MPLLFADARTPRQRYAMLLITPIDFLLHAAFQMPSFFDVFFFRCLRLFSSLMLPLMLLLRDTTMSRQHAIRCR